MNRFCKYILFGAVLLVSSCQNKEGGPSSQKTFSLSEASYGKVVSLVDDPTETIAPGWEPGEAVFVGTDASDGAYVAVQGGKVTAEVPSSASKLYVCRAAGVTLDGGVVTVSPAFNGSAADAAISFAKVTLDSPSVKMEPACAMLVFSVKQASLKAVRIQVDEAVFPVKITYDFGWRRLKATSKSKKIDIPLSGRDTYYVPLLPDVQIKNYTFDLIGADGSVAGSSTGALVWKTVAGQALLLGDADGDIPVVDPSVQPSEPASSAVKSMGVGVNLCSSFEVLWDETASSAKRDDPSTYETQGGNGITTQATIEAFAAAGFKCVRIPITWWPHMDNVYDATIDKVWLDRIAEVVNYALDAGLYCIINMHHDAHSPSGQRGEWLYADSANYGNITKGFQNVWTQIATYFKDYDYKLLFEGYNEITDASGAWFAPKDAGGFETANRLNQDFVNAVRRTGGRNGTRNLVVSTYSCGDMEASLSGFVMPSDVKDGHLIVQIHCYRPAPFVTVNPSTAVAAYNHLTDITEIKEAMARVKRMIVDRGWPCVMGEYGASPFYFDSSYKRIPRPVADRAQHALDATTEALKVGIAPIYWYTPMEGGHRTTGKWTYPEIKDALIQALNENQ